MGKIDLDVKLGYNDVSIKPAFISDIRHRFECNPYVDAEKKFLPIFTAPMTSVVDENNFELFEKNGIIPILPRKADRSLEKRLEYSLNGKWAAYSLDEFEKTWCNYDNILKYEGTAHVLVDMANGHVKRLYKLVRGAKKIYGDQLQVMIGNVANPQTYEYAARHGVDYIRLIIGGGEGCLTTPITGVNYPAASLIRETATIRDRMKLANPYGNIPKIVADGGIKCFADAVKAIALGADYVMIGGLLARTIESASPCKFATSMLEMEMNGSELIENENFKSYGNGRFTFKTHKSDEEFEENITIYKIFYGMASPYGQRDLGVEGKVAEGLVKMFRAEYTLEEWVAKMTHAFKSAMSYTNSRRLIDLQDAELVRISQSAYECINK